jgi:hypothetical protein
VNRGEIEYVPAPLRQVTGTLAEPSAPPAEPAFTLVGALPENLDSDLKEIDDAIAVQEMRLSGITERVKALDTVKAADLGTRMATVEKEQQAAKTRLADLKRAREENRTARATVENAAPIKVFGLTEKQRQEAAIKEQRIRFLEGRTRALEDSLKLLERVEDRVERCRGEVERIEKLSGGRIVAGAVNPVIFARDDLLAAELQVKVNREADKLNRKRLEEYRNELRKLHETSAPKPDTNPPQTGAPPKKVDPNPRTDPPQENSPLKKADPVEVIIEIAKKRMADKSVTSFKLDDLPAGTTEKHLDGVYEVFKGTGWRVAKGIGGRNGSPYYLSFSWTKGKRE